MIILKYSTYINGFADRRKTESLNSIQQAVLVSISRSCCTGGPSGGAQFRVDVGDVPFYRSDTDEVIRGYFRIALAAGDLA